MQLVMAQTRLWLNLIKGKHVDIMGVRMFHSSFRQTLGIARYLLLGLEPYAVFLQTPRK